MVSKGWKRAQLCDVAPLQRGFDLPKRLVEEGPYPVVFSNGVGAHHAQALVKGPGVVTGRSGTIGSVQYVKEDFWPHNTTLWVTNFHGNDERFIYYLLQTLPWSLYTSGSGVPTLNRNDVHRAQVLLPQSRLEQQAIAQVLSDLDQLLQAQQALMDKKQAIRQGVMQRLLSGSSRLPGFSGAWFPCQLGDVCQIGTGSRNNEQKCHGGRYPFFVRSQTVERIDSYSFDGEAILIPGEGNIGQIFHYINGKFDYHQRVYKISDFPAHLCGKYLYYQMKASFGPYALRNTVKATVDSLRLPTFQRFTFPCPPTREEQQAIVQILSDLDGELDALMGKLEKYRQLRQGVMEQLLTGKIQVPYE